MTSDSKPYSGDQRDGAPLPAGGPNPPRAPEPEAAALPWVKAWPRMPGGA